MIISPCIACLFAHARGWMASWVSTALARKSPGLLHAGRQDIQPFQPSERVRASSQQLERGTGSAYHGIASINLQDGFMVTFWYPDTAFCAPRSERCLVWKPCPVPFRGISLPEPPSVRQELRPEDLSAAFDPARGIPPCSSSPRSFRTALRS